MIFSMSVVCPKYDCGKKHNVILDGLALPSVTDRYEFICPSCQSRVMFIPQTVVEVVSIPPGSVMAKPR